MINRVNNGLLHGLLILVPYFYFGGHPAGWLLMAISYVPIVLFRKELVIDRNESIVLWLIITAHHMVAVYNAYISTIVGADRDALNFHTKAAVISESGEYSFQIGAGLYTNMLAFFYKMTGPDLLVGQELSVLATTISCFFFVGILHQLNVSKYCWAPLIVFGLIPSTLVFSSITLREPFMLLFFLGATYFFVQSRKTNVYWYFFAAILLATLLGLLHQLLVIFATIFILLYVLFPVTDTARSSFIGKNQGLLSVLAVLIIVSAYFLLSWFHVVGGEILLKLYPDNILDFLVEYRSVSENQLARTAFNIYLDNETVLTTIRSLLFIYVKYLFAPYPWEIKELIDLVAAAESLFRFAILLCCIVSMWRAPRGTRNIQFMLMVSYIAMTFLWSLGSTNYGQALRHNVLSNWILLAVSTPLVTEIVRSKRWQTYFGRGEG